MSRYIDADELIKTISSTKFTSLGANDILVTCCQIVIDNAPTADVIEVVRCKDCKWWKAFNDTMGHCGCDMSHKDFYCARGKRADE